MALLSRRNRVGSRGSSLAAAVCLFALVGILGSCGDDVAGPPSDPSERILLSTDLIDLGSDRSASFTIRNDGPVAEGPIEFESGPVSTLDGVEQVGSEVVVSPAQIATLNPDDQVSVQVSIRPGEQISPGDYTAQITPRLQGATLPALQVRFSIIGPEDPLSAIEIVEAPAKLRQGDVAGFSARGTDLEGESREDIDVAWSVVPADAGLIGADGRFVGYRAGSTRIVASSGAVSDTILVEVTPRGLSGDFAEIGHGPMNTRYTSDLWVHGEHAYTGTWGSRIPPGGAGENLGNRLYAWSIADPAGPVLTDSLEIDARVVNDVKVTPDGTLAIATHELSSDGQNGITLIDLSDPARPEAIGRYTNGLTSGIHNVWLENDYAYLVLDGIGNGMRVLDITDPADPRPVASFVAESSFLHDIYVRDGLAFLSHWDAGLIILDVGNGEAGGSPANPVELGRVQTQGGQTHNAWYWPESGYVFVGEEDFGTPGMMHVVDASDLRNPREVASFRVAGDTPHNFWLDEDDGILYAAWYSSGVRALDVTGELLGQLERQGREIASHAPAPTGGCPGGTTGTCTWAPQLHDGLLWLSDMNRGLFSLAPQL